MILEESTYIKPSIFDGFPKVVAAQSTRHGGVSPFPYNSLNLGPHTADAASNVSANRKIFLEALGFKSDALGHGFQTHGDQIWTVERSGYVQGYDAFVTNKKNLPIGVYLADCTPILIYDSESETIAALHSGWLGTVAESCRKTLEYMQKHFQSNPKHCYAYIGTCIDKCTFEVDADVADHFAEDLKRWDADKQKFFVDLKKANQLQLENCGVPTSQIEVSPYSTITHNEHFFSHRKEKGKTGRMLAVIGMLDT